MRGNTFRNNTGAGVIKINTAAIAVSGEIEENVFLNNSRFSSVMNTVYIVYSFRILLANNVFDNPNADHEIHVPKYWDGKRINATHCYWGVTSYATVISR